MIFNQSQCVRQIYRFIAKIRVKNNFYFYQLANGTQQIPQKCITLRILSTKLIIIAHLEFSFILGAHKFVKNYSGVVIQTMNIFNL
jgi:hypothetical protein